MNIIRHFVEVAGADRIVWGADAPLFSMAQQLCKVLFANISDEDKEKILYRNAAKLFPCCEFATTGQIPVAKDDHLIQNI
jgi:predicted TIM-barrel fold metal-dependent hydrolase